MRNKRRTVLTVLSVSLAIFVLSTLLTLVHEIDRNLEESNPLRLVTRHAVSPTNMLPLRHRARIEQIPGVVAVTPFTWFGGIYIDEAHTDFAQFACDPRVLFDIYTEIRLPPEQRRAFIRERTAVIVGRRKAEEHGWTLGDRITLRGTVFPVDLELTIRGIFTGSVNDESSIFFHHEYFEQALKETMGWPAFTAMYWLRVDSISSVSRVSQAIDALFRNTDAPTKTETERAFQAEFFTMLGNLKTLVATLSGVILFTLLLVTMNTMAMSVRERTREIAIMKSLGFRRREVLALLIAEGLLMTLTGGLIGSLVARLIFTHFALVDIGRLTLNIFQRFEVTGEVIGLGLLASALVGLLSTVIPASRAARLTVADGLRHLG